MLRMWHNLCRETQKMNPLLATGIVSLVFALIFSAAYSLTDWAAGRSLKHNGFPLSGILAILGVASIITMFGAIIALVVAMVAIWR